MDDEHPNEQLFQRLRVLPIRAIVAFAWRRASRVQQFIRGLGFGAAFWSGRLQNVIDDAYGFCCTDTHGLEPDKVREGEIAATNSVGELVGFASRNAAVVQKAGRAIVHLATCLLCAVQNDARGAAWNASEASAEAAAALKGASVDDDLERDFAWVRQKWPDADDHAIGSLDKPGS